MRLLEERIKKVENLINEQVINEQKKFILLEMKRIGIEKLPYSYSSLKSFIDAETMNIHYNKHYKGYVEKLNKALAKKEYGDLELDQIIRTINKFSNVMNMRLVSKVFKKHFLFRSDFIPLYQENAVLINKVSY